MSRTHLLVEKAFVYDGGRDLKDPKGSFYDDVLGAWLCGDNNEFLVRSKAAGRPRPTTKKGDMETGEDLKGA